MWLRCLLIIFFTTQNAALTFDFDSSDVKAEEEWESAGSLSLSADDYENYAFMPEFKSGPQVARVPASLDLPGFVRIQASELRKDIFAPEKGFRPVPAEVRAILLPVSTVTQAPPTDARVKNVEVLCHLDRMHVRVRKSFFTKDDARKYLKLGTCAVNKATPTHYYFLYFLRGCGIKRSEDANSVTYTNVLIYEPAVTGPIVRDLQFSMPIRCSYNKFHRSYQAGFWPMIGGGTIYRGLHNKAGVSLTAMDPSWNVLPVGSSFSLGQPICFEAKAPSGGGNRLYLSSCFSTSSPNPTSTEQYGVLENSGCLVDSKNSTLTKFYRTTEKTTVRLCFAAFFFKNMVSTPYTKKTMFLHCESFLGPDVPTPSSKSCTFNLQTKRWSELYGAASVCECCESTCPAPPKSSGKTIITSKSWDLKMGQETAAWDSVPEFSVDDHDYFEFWESNEY